MTQQEEISNEWEDCRKSDVMKVAFYFGSDPLLGESKLQFITSLLLSYLGRRSISCQRNGRMWSLFISREGVSKVML